MIAFSGSVPENYHRHLGPVLFEPYAKDLAARIGDVQRLLEIACGTGIVSQALARQLPDATIVATDLNQAMLDIAMQHVDSKRVTFRQADAMQLPFGDGEFDAVVCQFGFMFVPDKVVAFREVRRVLRRDGLFAFNVWDSLAANDGSRTVNDVVRALFPSDPPRFIDIPFSMHDRRAIERWLRDAGFQKIKIRDLPLMSESPSAKQFASGYVQGTPLADSLRQRGGDFDQITTAVEKELARLYGDRPMRSRMQAIVVEAR